MLRDKTEFWTLFVILALMVNLVAYMMVRASDKEAALKQARTISSVK